jgi:peptide/nickel transport system permease protein
VLGYLSKRLAWAGVLLLAVSLVTYILFFVIPVDPLRRAVGTTGEPLTVREAYAIEGPIWREYPAFVWNAVTNFDLGNSRSNRQPVTQILRHAAPVTISLVAGAAVIWLLIALPVGVISALRPRSLLDRAGMVFVLIGISLHPLWIGLMLSYFAGYRWGVAPIGGYCRLFNENWGQCVGPVPWAEHLMLPWLTLALMFAAIYSRMIRASVLETLNDEYIRTARAKGASAIRVLRAHILRNALLPVVTMLGMDLGVALTSAFFVEIAFGLPGMGTESIRALRRRDLPVIVGVTLTATTALVILTTVVDVLYGLFDPRVRRSRRERPEEREDVRGRAPAPVAAARAK